MKTDWHRKVYKRKAYNPVNKDEWAKLRSACFSRDHFTCQRCDKKKSASVVLTVHHIIPRDNDGANDLSNLITLCSPCHDFVEIHNLKSFSEIAGSYEDDFDVNLLKPTKNTNEEGYHFERPAWHKWVYGGGKNPQTSTKNEE